MLYSRKYGIEIECILPRTQSMQAVAQAITAAGVQCMAAGYTHARTGYWKIVSDGSVSGNGNGMELVSPPLQGADSLAQIMTISQVLNQLGATVNRSCGLHVHVDAAGLSVAALRKLAAIYIENENIIDSFMPTSRRGSANYYCNTLRGTDLARLATAQDARQIAAAIAGGNRYVKLNYAAYLRHGTVEFRHHSGTVDAAKIVKWLQACMRMVACAAKEADLPIATGASARPRNRRLAIIYDAMQRPGGCTRQDIANLLNRRTMPPMNRILRNAGFTYRTERRYGDRTERYVLSGDVVNASAAAPVTFDAFCDRLEMPAEEKEFWIARRIAVGSATLAAAA